MNAARRSRRQPNHAPLGAWADLGARYADLAWPVAIMVLSVLAVTFSLVPD